MTQPDPSNPRGYDGPQPRLPDPGWEINAPLQIPARPTWQHIGPGAEEVKAKVNRDNAAASLAWILFLVVLASAVPLVVGVWRAVF